MKAVGHNTFKMARDLFDAALWGYPGGGQGGRKKAQGLSCPLLISPFRCATMTAAQEKQEGTTMEKTKAKGAMIKQKRLSLEELCLDNPMAALSSWLPFCLPFLISNLCRPSRFLGQ